MKEGRIEQYEKESVKEPEVERSKKLRSSALSPYLQSNQIQHIQLSTFIGNKSKYHFCNIMHASQKVPP